MIKLNTPLKDVTKLRLGDFVSISGTLYTARDMAHKYLVEKKPKLIPKDSIIYHCGPIVKKIDNEWKVIAAGPTTSIREEPYEADIIKNYKIKAIIGKGGMGEKTANAMKKYGCVYLSAVGGAASYLAQCIKKVTAVHKLKEFGMPEAIWELEVKDFPAIVTIDSKGNNYVRFHRNTRK